MNKITIVKKMNQFIACWVIAGSLALPIHAMEQPNPTDTQKKLSELMRPIPVRALPTAAPHIAPGHLVLRMERSCDGKLIPLFFCTNHKTDILRTSHGSSAFIDISSAKRKRIEHAKFAEKMADEPVSSQTSSIQTSRLPNGSLSLSAPISTSNGYCCPFCKFTSADSSNCRKHINIKHRGIRKQCPFCSKSYTTRATVKKHMQKYHPEKYTDSGQQQ